jgi:hypothetical protein
MQIRALLKRATLAACAAGFLVACATVEKAAAKDPMKCERDPSCSRGRTSYQDCYKQCVDDPACVERCETVQRGIDGAGGTPR